MPGADRCFHEHGCALDGDQERRIVRSHEAQHGARRRARGRVGRPRRRRAPLPGGWCPRRSAGWRAASTKGKAPVRRSKARSPGRQAEQRRAAPPQPPPVSTSRSAAVRRSSARPQRTSQRSAIATNPASDSEAEETVGEKGTPSEQSGQPADREPLEVDEDWREQGDASLLRKTSCATLGLLDRAEVVVEVVDVVEGADERGPSGRREPGAEQQSDRDGGEQQPDQQDRPRRPGQRRAVDRRGRKGAATVRRWRSGRAARCTRCTRRRRAASRPRR